MNTYRKYSLIMVVIGLCGCATSGIEATGKPNAEPDYAKHLVIHNETLADKVIIQAMQSRSQNGLLEVSIVLANLTNTDKNIQYRFAWYDEDDFEVEQGSRSWTPLTLTGKATANLRALAPNPSVSTYKINVRELR